MKIELIVVVVGGLVALVSLLFQKYLDYQRTVDTKKLELYNEFLKGSAQNGPKENVKNFMNSIEIVSIYGSDEVVRALNAFMEIIRNPSQYPNFLTVTSERYEQLLLIMRKDIVKRTKLSPNDYKHIHNMRKQGHQ